MAGLPVEIPNITLPIGISFFTFQGLRYVLDVFRGETAAEKNLLRVALCGVPAYVEGYRPEVVICILSDTHFYIPTGNGAVWDGDWKSCRTRRKEEAWKRKGPRCRPWKKRGI